MQQLSGLDAAFLALETANTTGHVGGVCVLDPREAPQPLVGYLGRLHFGLTGCRELVPDIDTIASYLVEELELLAKAAAPHPAGAARKAK
jgi:WS/DGAT C-terminal domain